MRLLKVTRVLLATCTALATPALAQAPAAEHAGGASTRPNLVIFLADDLGEWDTQPYGDRTARTPNLARLAASGLSFDRAFVASPACAPSRAALLTGQMPARNGAEANHEAPREDVRKLPAYLHSLGYQVVSFGKVAHYEQTKLYGFDHWEHDTFHDPKAIPAAIRWLKARRDDRPLALFVGSNWPHVPWPKGREGYAPARLSLPAKSVDNPATREARARYYAAVTRMDQELGNTLAVADKVLGPRTMVLFSSDHGAQWPFGKWNLYDTGTRVPLVVRWTGHVTPGTRTNAMVNWTDILPTLVEVGGGKAPEGIDGRSFAAALEPGQTFAGRDEIYTTHNNDRDVNVYPMRSVRTDRWKYIANLQPTYTYTTHIDQYVKLGGKGGYFKTWREQAASDAGARRIVNAYYHRPAEELYDLSADPFEEHNLAADPGQAATMADLRARLARWRAAQGDTHPIAGKPHMSEGPIEGKTDD